MRQRRCDSLLMNVRLVKERLAPAHEKFLSDLFNEFSCTCTSS